MGGINADFVAAVDTWAKMVLGDMEAVVKNSIVRTADVAIDATPIRTGLLSGSYNGAGYQPSASKSRIRSQVSSLQLGGVFSIYNDTDYASYIEYGTDKIRPFGMMQKAVNEWPRIVTEEVAKRAR